MADMSVAVTSTGGIAFLVSAGLVYEIVAAACSSPQTTEINADKRADTLMKWVVIGLAMAAVFIGLAARIDPKHRAEIIAGGALAGGLMYGAYYHARAVGLKSSAPGTEQY